MFILRLLLGFTVLVYFILASYAWGHMIAGNIEPLADLIGFDPSSELNWIAGSVLLLSNAALLTSLAMIAYAAHIYANSRKHDGKLSKRTITAVRLIGLALFGLWLALFLEESAFPSILEFQNSGRYDIPLPLDVNLVALLLGALLLYIAEDLRQGRVADEENKQIV